MAILSPDPTSCFRNNKCLSGPNRGLAYNALKPCPDNYIFDPNSCDCSLPPCRSGWVLKIIQNAGTSQIWQQADCSGYGTYIAYEVSTNYVFFPNDWRDVRVVEDDCTCGKFYKVEGFHCGTNTWEEIYRIGCSIILGFYGIKEDEYPWTQEYAIIEPG